MYGDDKLQPTFDAALKSQHICRETSTDLFIKHDSKFGGYNILITPKDGHGVVTNGQAIISALSATNYTSAYQAYTKAYAASYANNKGTTACDAITSDAADAVVKDPKSTTVSQLKPVIETVQITTATSAIELAGAFTVSNLRDPKYALSPASGPNQIIIENKSAEDSRKLGVAGFIHVHAPNCTGSTNWIWLCNHIAATAGLGVTNNNNLSIFVGPSYRFAGQWFATVGYNWGAITALPSSDHVGLAPSSSTVLSNLGTRTAGAFFFAVSYAFLNPGTSFFQKPISSTPKDTTPPAK
jgi:hypothetical protein